MKESLPILLLKKLVLLPDQEIRLEINNEVSKIAIDEAIKLNNSNILVISPINLLEEKPSASDLPKIGVIGKIKTKIKLPNNNYRIIIKGLNRVEVIEYFQNNVGILKSVVKRIYIKKTNEVKETALIRKIKELIQEYILLNSESSNVITSTIENINDLDLLTDIVVGFLPMDLNKKLLYMNEFNYIKRAETLIKDINIELEVINLDTKIDDEIREKFEKEQRDFILKEKINKLNNELGILTDKQLELNHYKKILDDLDISDKVKNKLYNEIKRYEYTNDNNPDASVIRNYLEWVLNLPWNKYSLEETNLDNIKKSLDKTHYGLETIKKRILEFVSIKKINKDVSNPILCLVGPPGVGKTTLGISISHALNREFYKISVGGLNDSSELVGHRKTFLGANPGKIIQGINKCGVMNPVILIDEIDKMNYDYKRDPSSTFLEILDESQNKMFVDNYIEEPFDLSKVMFILTANNINDIPGPLRDRLEIIEINSYTEYEKLDIVKKYLIPDILSNYGLKNINFSDDTILNIINNYTRESGVRELNRILKRLIRNYCLEKNKSKEITNNDVLRILGVPKYTKEEILNHKGVVNSLAWTPYGGNIQKIECISFNGTGKIITTGNIANILEESIKVAISYIKLKKYTTKNFDELDLHINALHAGIKKDGSSGGVAITTAILSIIKNKIINENIAMTGEITLNGDILAVGGIKEKIIGAYNNNIKTIYIPYNNNSDLESIPDNIKEKLEIKLVKNYGEIYIDLFSK
ncbi:MAG: endopeptidase La [Bacilli bacterium]|nr:endopeptidase La [Bacilli bacterium]